MAQDEIQALLAKYLIARKAYDGVAFSIRASASSTADHGSAAFRSDRRLSPAEIERRLLPHLCEIGRQLGRPVATVGAANPLSISGDGVFIHCRIELLVQEEPPIPVVFCLAHLELREDLQRKGLGSGIVEQLRQAALDLQCDRYWLCGSFTPAGAALVSACGGAPAFHGLEPRYAFEVPIDVRIARSRAAPDAFAQVTEHKERLLAFLRPYLKAR